MTTSPIDCYQLPVASISDLINQPVGKLKPLLALESDIAPYTAFDCFDHPLRHSGRLLLKTQDTLELFSESSRPLSQPTDHEICFVSGLAKGPIKQALSNLSSLRRLLPLGTGQRQHAVLTLTDDEEKTHCRAYLLFITAENGRATALAVLQGLKGYNVSLDALRERIIDLGGMLVTGNTLYESLFPLQSIYDAKPEIAISGDTRAFDAANQIISTHIPIARANEHGIIADHDTEFLHDYRIQLRKIRSVISLFQGIYTDAQTAELKARFSAIMAPTGRLRDLDVYLLEKQAYYDLLPKNLHNGLSAFYGMLASQRQTEQAKLASYLCSQPYLQEMKKLAALYVQPQTLAKGPNATLAAHDYASRLIWKRYRKVCKIAAGIDDTTPDADVHALRIQCKKLRYLMEFFGTIFPPADFKSLLKSLKGLQDNLGRFNDYSVQQASLHAALPTLRENQGDDHLEVAQSIGALIAVLHTRQLKERAKIVKNFMRFNSPETQQTFRKLFQERKA
ncbi:CHAD domain-containing protein [Pollutimonas harenae]|uniref:CHAD domain-containing protein n=1 Tax=Pollutimonas harenae TaxID=657015 RepID=A0A853H3X8_9BURK|nr:CHAD domain-containing protein [Pollutimonas harenae]NYT86730.1 CHAD domain-containing protein [Pollutimonas harenae]TEA71380.1 CHAD domain-containing protein [Pollutimonas harenae]